MMACATRLPAHESRLGILRGLAVTKATAGGGHPTVEGRGRIQSGHAADSSNGFDQAVDFAAGVVD